MTLVEVLEAAALPSVLMETNFLRVPVEGFNDDVIHLSLKPCRGLPGVNEFYNNLREGFVSSQTLFKNISFNDFLGMQDLFCTACSRGALVNANGLVLTGKGPLEVITLIKVLLHWVKRMNKDVTGESRMMSFKQDWAWYHGFNMHLLLSSFPETVTFVEGFKNLLFKSQVDNVEQLRVDCVNFIITEALPKASSVNMPAVTSDVINECMDGFRVQLREKLLNDTSFVIVNSFPVQQAIVRLSNGNDLFYKIAFSPNFNINKFSVISYVEFKALEYLLTSTNDSFSSLSNHVVCATEPSPAVVKLMAELFDENNVTLKKYENLFNVAVNI